ncbi:hypothetical protein GQ457_14G014590 [Hibiscus cannabinus]
MAPLNTIWRNSVKGRLKDVDIIDCVQIFHQPAFDHSFLKDHKVQVRYSTPFRLAKEYRRSHLKLRKSACSKRSLVRDNDKGVHKWLFDGKQLLVFTVLEIVIDTGG